jgi:hypothetical protein
MVRGHVRKLGYEPEYKDSTFENSEVYEPVKLLIHQLVIARQTPTQPKSLNSTGEKQRTLHRGHQGFETRRSTWV